MKINKDAFFAKIRTIFGKLSQQQVDGFNAIIDEFERRNLTELRHLAYMIATAWHETGGRMCGIKEIGLGRGKAYGSKIDINRKPYQMPDKLYYGRGLVQITWRYNYKKIGDLIRVDLLNNPDKALELDVAVKIMFEGMLKADSNFGDFTGKCLEQYFNTRIDDPVGARKIINGVDKANLIAGYHRNILEALK